VKYYVTKTFYKNNITIHVIIYHVSLLYN